ncbi:MAG: CdaR family protein [Chloroflexi bacterium]|nr:CdaR family protein [Chloroflexota bacterium]
MVAERIAHFVTHTLGIRFLVALVAATGLWVWRTEQTLPGTVDVSVPTAIPVEISGQLHGLVVVPQQGGTPTVHIRVSVPTRDQNRVSVTWFKATVNVSQTTQPGTQLYPVTVESLEPGVVVDTASIVPSAIPVTLDRISQRQFQIQPVYQGNLPAGYTYALAQLDNNSVTISGPQTILNQIASVVAVVRLDNREKTFNETVSLIPQNAEGGDVSTSDLTLSPKTVSAHVEIHQQAVTKTVPVLPQLTGQPAPGYVVSSITVAPQTLTIVGNPSAIDPLTAIPTNTINIANASSNQTISVGLQAPSGVQIAGANKVQVTVAITALPSSVILAVAPKVEGVPNGWQVRVATTSVNLTLQGPASVLHNLQARNIAIIVNVAGLSSGDHQVTPSIHLPNQVSLVATDPGKVSLTMIAPTPTSTPTPQPTVTPSPSPSPTSTATP